MASTGVNESETYAYSYSQSEKIRQIMAHKEAKLREEEASENLKDGALTEWRLLLHLQLHGASRIECRERHILEMFPICTKRASDERNRVTPDVNLEILEEADQEEALGGPVNAEATPLSLFSGVSSAPPYSGTISAAPIVGGVSGGRVPSAIVNGQPVFSNDASDPFGGVLRGATPMPSSRQVSAAPMNMYTSSAAPIWPGGERVFFTPFFF